MKATIERTIILTMTDEEAMHVRNALSSFVANDPSSECTIIMGVVGQTLDTLNEALVVKEEDSECPF